MNPILSPPTSQALYILISRAAHNRFSSCLAMRSVWLSSTERQRDYAESGESLCTVGTGETTHKITSLNSPHSSTDTAHILYSKYAKWMPTHNWANCRHRHVNIHTCIQNNNTFKHSSGDVSYRLSLVSLAQYQTVLDEILWKHPPDYLPHS